jgi:hypothetical protein
VPHLQYPDGYTVTVTGAQVTSGRCADRLTLRNRHRSDEVSVRIVPGGGCG